MVGGGVGGAGWGEGRSGRGAGSGGPGWRGVEWGERLGVGGVWVVGFREGWEWDRVGWWGTEWGEWLRGWRGGGEEWSRMGMGGGRGNWGHMYSVLLWHNSSSDIYENLGVEEIG